MRNLRSSQTETRQRVQLVHAYLIFWFITCPSIIVFNIFYVLLVIQGIYDHLKILATWLGN